MAVFHNLITQMNVNESIIFEIETRVLDARQQVAALEAEFEAAVEEQRRAELASLAVLVADRDALDSLVDKINILIESQGLTLIVRRQRGAKAALDACEENP